jgi:VWFA-related protein
MRRIRALLCGVSLTVTLLLPLLGAQTAPPPSTPTFRVTTRLVFLDVTVLDKKGRPVTKGLTKDDFIITDNKQPQPIVSFEAPDQHVDMSTASENPSGKAPATVLVLDLLNSKATDFSYIRYEVRKFLEAQPERLSSPTELLVLGNVSLEMPQAYTRSKADLLDALDHVPAAIPFKLIDGSFWPERFTQSVDALQQIAVQNRGIPGRKNIIWVGHGSPAVFTARYTGKIVDELNQYVHDTTNMLVDSRMSLFVIYPGMSARGMQFDVSEESAGIDLGDNDPFKGDINFGVFVNETGGNLFYNRNDIAAEIRRSENLGAQYYTLTYAPPDGPADGKFRRVRVTLRDHSLRALTKAGYFAPAHSTGGHRRQQNLIEIGDEIRSPLPFSELPVTVVDLVRHPDTGRVEFNVVLKDPNIGWQQTDNGKSTANLLLAAASLNADREVLASKVVGVTVTEPTRDPAQLAKETVPMHVRLRVPSKTRSVRVVVQSTEDARAGAVEVSRELLNAAPAAPAPEALLRRPSH